MARAFAPPTRIGHRDPRSFNFRYGTADDVDYHTPFNVSGNSLG
jgi:hypothetical protein